MKCLLLKKYMFLAHTSIQIVTMIQDKRDHELYLFAFPLFPLHSASSVCSCSSLKTDKARQIREKERKRPTNWCYKTRE